MHMVSDRSSLTHRQVHSLELHPRVAGLYAAVLDGEELVTARAPICAAARVLLARGARPASIIETRHRGSLIVAMRGTVGWFAARTVREDERRGPEFVRWAPRPQDAVSRDADDANFGRSPSGGTGPALDEKRPSLSPPARPPP